MTYDSETLFLFTYQDGPGLDLTLATSDVAQQICPPPPWTWVSIPIREGQGGKIYPSQPLTSYTTDTPPDHACGITYLSGWAEARSTLWTIHTLL